MRLTIERSALQRALAHVQSVVERRNTIPILSNVLMRADADALQLTATDMDLEIVESAAGAVEMPGATTVAAHTLFDIVRKLPEGSQVQLELDQAPDGGARLVLQAGRSRFRLACLPVEDFPVMTGADLETRFTMSAKDLRSMIDRTRFAISVEETRYYLNGIYLHVTDAAAGSDPVLRAVATDGHRLARVEVPMPAGADTMPGIIVPRKTVAELLKLIDDTTEEITVRLSESRICFEVGGALLTSKLIDGTFPDYQRVIPADYDRTMTVDNRAFTAAVDRVATIATEKSRAVKLALDGTTLTVSATSVDQGAAQEEVAVSYESDNMDIGFNARYLLDIADQIGESAEFRMTDPSSPTVICDVNDGSALFVLMPMRV